jgi:microcystin-dependent protein
MTKFKETFAEKTFSLLVGISLLLAAVGIFIGQTMQPARSQLAGAQTWLGTAGGTANAITLSIHNVVALSDLIGVPFRFLPSTTNTGPTTITINLDSSSTLGPITVDRPTSNIGLQGLSGNEFISGQIAEVAYDGTLFEIKHPIDMTPIGHSVEFRGGSAPAGTLVEDGSCYSQTTYAALFSVIGTTYNAGAPVGCTGGNFAVPYSNGTVFNASDTQGSHTASRITTASCATPGTVGTLCGGQTHTLITAELPVHTPSGTVSSSASAEGNNGAVCGVGTGATIGLCGQVGNTITSSFAGNSIGSGAAHAILNTTLIGVRAIKY